MRSLKSQFMVPAKDFVLKQLTSMPALSLLTLLLTSVRRAELPAGGCRKICHCLPFSVLALLTPAEFGASYGAFIWPYCCTEAKLFGRNLQDPKVLSV